MKKYKRFLETSKYCKKGNSIYCLLNNKDRYDLIHSEEIKEKEIDLPYIQMDQNEIIVCRNKKVKEVLESYLEKNPSLKENPDKIFNEDVLEEVIKEGIKPNDKREFKDTSKDVIVRDRIFKGACNHLDWDYKECYSNSWFFCHCNLDNLTDEIRKSVWTIKVFNDFKNSYVEYCHSCYSNEMEVHVKIFQNGDCVEDTNYSLGDFEDNYQGSKGWRERKGIQVYSCYRQKDFSSCEIGYVTKITDEVEMKLFSLKGLEKTFSIPLDSFLSEFEEISYWETDELNGCEKCFTCEHYNKCKVQKILRTISCSGNDMIYETALYEGLVKDDIKQFENHLFKKIIDFQKEWETCKMVSFGYEIKKPENNDFFNTGWTMKVEDGLKNKVEYSHDEGSDLVYVECFEDGDVYKKYSKSLEEIKEGFEPK